LVKELLCREGDIVELNQTLVKVAGA